MSVIQKQPPDEFCKKRYSVKKAFSGLLTDGGGQIGLLHKICQTYPTMTKLYSYTLPKEDPKII